MNRQEQHALDRIKLIRSIELKIEKTRQELAADIMRRDNIKDLVSKV